MKTAFRKTLFFSIQLKPIKKSITYQGKIHLWGFKFEEDSDCVNV